MERFKAGYDYIEHGSNTSQQAGLLTERMLDSIAVAGTAEEALVRFRALAALGIGKVVCPLGMRDPVPYLRSLAEQVAPKLLP